MRSLLVFLALTFSAFAQNKVTPDCDIPFTFTVATERSQFGGCGQNGQGTWEWRVVYYVNGFSAVSVELQDAPDSNGAPGTWVTWAGTITSGYSNPSTATPQGSISATGYFPWASVLLVSKTGTGSVTGHLYGCREPGCSIAGPGGGGGGGGSGCVGTVATPCQIGVDNAGATLPSLGDVNGRLQLGAGAASQTIALSSSGLTQIIPASSGNTTTIFHISVLLQSAATFQLEYGTGSNCGTGTTALTGVYPSNFTGATWDPGDLPIVPASNAVCVNLGSSVTGGGVVTYSQP
jgi:hypothetical protein